jgi:N-acetylglucosaminyldiphosphoundecaprenol N-acetyl-beta-D-mannosaminyltransferase
LLAHFPSYDLFGAKITPMTSADILELLTSHIDAREQCVIASQNMHGLHVRLWDEATRRLHSRAKTYVHIDGMPIIALCRICGIHASRDHRVGITHFIWPLLSHAADLGWRIFYVGSEPEVLQRAVSVIKARLPHLQLGTHHGYFANPYAASQAAHAAAAFDAQLVLVGMGMGWQERWILQNMQTLSPACVVTVGACLEYVAGEVKVAPGWLSRIGCEWMFRLLETPTRFWYRYLVEPWFVLGYIAWYSTLPPRARLAGRIEELEQLPIAARETELRELAPREAELRELA